MMFVYSYLFSLYLFNYGHLCIIQSRAFKQEYLNVSIIYGYLKRFLRTKLRYFTKVKLMHRLNQSILDHVTLTLFT